MWHYLAKLDCCNREQRSFLCVNVERAVGYTAELKTKQNNYGAGQCLWCAVRDVGIRTSLSMHIETMVYGNNAYRKNGRMVDKKMKKVVN